MANKANVITPAANTAAVYTKAAVATRRNQVRGFVWSYSAAPTGGGILVESPSGTTILDIDIIAGGPGSLDLSDTPLIGGKNAALIVTLKAGGGVVAGKLTVVNPEAVA